MVFDKSGWFLVRAVTSSTETYQYASTGPYYVEQDYQPLVSRSSVKYFLEWIDEAERKFAGNESVLNDFRTAKPFWEELLSRSTED